MNMDDLSSDMNNKLYKHLMSKHLKDLRPCQIKSIDAGLLNGKNILVCAPTASGKTLVGEIAMLQRIYEYIGKAIYIVPLKALASEKYDQFKQDYPDLNIKMSTGDFDDSGERLKDFDILFCTSEKLDSLFRHKVSWLKYVATIIVDEIHLLNDVGRGPTLEIILTMIKTNLPGIQIVGLSATIGNPQELADWLNANLVMDDWRPVKLDKGIYLDGKVDFFD